MNDDATGRITSLRLPPFHAVRCDDLRLRPLCPGLASAGPVTVASIADTVPAGNAADLLAWAVRTADATLDDLVDELLEAWESTRRTLRPGLREAVAQRLGLRGDPPAAVVAAAHATRVPAERVRQAAAEFEAAVQGLSWAPALEEALLLSRNPVDRHEYARSLAACGLSRRAWFPEAVNALARLGDRSARVLPHPDPSPVALYRLVTRTAHFRAWGVVSVGEAAAVAAAELGRPVGRDLVTACLAGSRGRLARAGDWIWRADGGRARPRVVRVALGMLAIAGALPITTIHRGWCRRLRGNGIADEPPVEALRAVLEAHPGFVVSESVVRLAGDVRPETVYGRCDLVLIDTIRAAPGRVADRAALMHAAGAAGVSAATVSVYLTYHEVFERHGPARWTLAGLTPALCYPTSGAPRPG